ncbi:hypothetical protein WMF01_06190 [Sorangium sp. So ce1667]
MPVSDLVERPVDQLRNFLSEDNVTLCCLQHNPDLKHVVAKILAGLEGEDGCEHAFIYCDTDFHAQAQYLSDTLGALVKANDAHHDELAAAGIVLPRPATIGRGSGLERLVTYLVSISAMLPVGGQYVIIIDPNHVRDRSAFAATIELLAQSVRASRVKLIVLDPSENPFFNAAQGQQLARGLVVTRFELAAGPIEAQVLRDLKRGRLMPSERRQYLAMAAAFAVARGEHKTAQRMRESVLQSAQWDGSPAERATALYDLGNSHLESSDFLRAEECFAEGARICLDCGLHPLLAMILVNLGVTLHRAGRIAESLESLGAARRTFAAIQSKPGEAYALDAQAAVLRSEGREREAEVAWLEALAVYDGITAGPFAGVRDAGRRDVMAKLERFYEATGRRAERDALRYR